MKKIRIRFERDETLDGIELVIHAAARDAQVEELIQSLIVPEPVRLTAYGQDNCPTVIDEKDIIFVSSDGKSAQIVTAHGRYRAKQSLQNMEEILDGDFFRVSRFEIINLKKVRKYDFTIGGTLRIEFDNGMETWASRRYIPDIKENLSREEGYLC